MTFITKFFEEDIKIPSPPAIAVRIIEAVKKDEASFNELGKIISSDPALSVKILKLANSAFYGGYQKIESISQALTRLGLRSVQNIALSFVITREMRGASDVGFDFDFFWKRSLTAAVSAHELSSFFGLKNEDLFVTALLQDIGVLIMQFCRKDDYLKVIDEKRTSLSEIDSVERKIFGFDHPELGAEILKKWGIPNSIYNPIRYHHQHSDIPQDHKMAANLLSLSDKISSVYHGSRSIEKMQEIKSILHDVRHVSEKDFESIIDSVATKSVELLSFFDISPGSMKPYSQILQEANEELGKLNLTYEQLVIDLKQSKERAEKYASELKQANQRLREMAFRDGLTGLYNHRYFQELLDKEISRAKRYNRPFALIMLDLDHFKNINDTYGHPVGDIVLKQVSKEIVSTLRESDVAARYGGEEFAIILTETNLKGAALAGERIRKAVEQLEINANGCRLGATISVGVTCYQISAIDKNKSEVLSAADVALYNSKKSGRNKISIVKLSS